MNCLAAVYARVSTMQQEQEATIENQVAELERYAKEKGCRLSKEYYFSAAYIGGMARYKPFCNNQLTRTEYITIAPKFVMM